MGALVDTWHINVIKESLSDYAYKLGDKLVHTHIADNDGMGGDHMPPGMGKIYFRPFITALKDIGYKGFLSVEPGLSYSSDPDGAAHFGLHHMRGILEK